MTDYSTLKAPYFETVSRKVLLETFEKNGFDEFLTNQVGVLFRRKDVYTRFYYLVEDYPNYKPMIDVGIILDDNRVGIDTKSVGLWYVLEDVSDFDYYNWSFRNEGELRTIMVAIRDIFIEKRIIEILHADKLEEFLQNKSAEIQKKYEDELRERKLRNAENRYKQGKYQEAVSLFEEVGMEHLKPTHRKMYLLAQKQGK